MSSVGVQTTTESDGGPALIHFPPFSVDLESGELRRAGATVALRPKSSLVLRHLVRRAGRLVTAKELREAVWANTHVSPGVIKVCISEIRAALGESARSARFLETVSRRGYRFRLPGGSAQGAAVEAPDPVFVGRTRELGQLDSCWRAALAALRGMVLVTGEAGIGKTALLDRFLAAARKRVPQPYVALGRCVERFGRAEASHPVFEALGSLCRAPELVPLLRRYAPSWLLQIPGALDASGRRQAELQSISSNRDRMLREVITGLEEVASRSPLVLVFEDLQWSDPATLDVVRALARRREAVPLFLIATSRPIDALGAADHPLPRVASELLAERHAIEIPLQRLDEIAVRQFVAETLTDLETPDELASVLWKRTDGHPLLLVSVLDDLRSAGRNSGASEPLRLESEAERSLDRTIERRLAGLPADDRRMLEAASVAGSSFAAAEVAAGLEIPVEPVELACRALARSRRFLRSASVVEWPDGTRSRGFEFTHELYREALYGSLEDVTRSGLHRRIGLRLEAAWQNQSDEIATRLAVHFEKSGDDARAVRHHLGAGRRARSRHADEAAVSHLRAGLAKLDAIPKDEDRDSAELSLLTALGPALINHEGFASPAVEATYARAYELCGTVGQPRDLFASLDGLHSYYVIRSQLDRGYELAVRMEEIAAREADPALIAEAAHVTGCSLLRRGRFAEAIERLERAVELCDAVRDADLLPFSGHDPKSCCLGHLAIASAVVGEPDRARAIAQEGIDAAKALGHAFSVDLAQLNSAWVHVVRGEDKTAGSIAGDLARRAREEGFPYWEGMGGMIQSWAEQSRTGENPVAAMLLAMGIARIESLLALAHAALAAERWKPAFDHVQTALALVERHDERFLEAELLRFRALALEGSRTRGPRVSRDRASASLRRALATAHRQGARWFELRALIDLAKLEEGRRPARVIETLGRLAASFTEGEGTPILREARELARP